MNMARLRTAAVGVLAVAPLLAACSEGDPPAVQRASSSATEPAAVAGTAGSSASSPSPAPSKRASTPAAPSGPRVPADLRRVNWLDINVSGEFCDVPRRVTLRKGGATADSTTHGRVHLGTWEDPTYADVQGDASPEAILVVGCDNGGGTADGQIAFAAQVFGRVGGRLTQLGTLPTQYEGRSHATLIAKITGKRGRIVVDESWYRENDLTCCATGVAETTWRLRGSIWVPGRPRVVPSN